jgi:hypothetical protein
LVAGQKFAKKTNLLRTIIYSGESRNAASAAPAAPGEGSFVGVVSP